MGDGAGGTGDGGPYLAPKVLSKGQGGGIHFLSLQTAPKPLACTLPG